jgi:outer membrane protein assembly factor BamA
MIRPLRRILDNAGRFLPCALVCAILTGVYNPARSQEEWRASVYKGWTVTSVEIQGVEKKMATDIEDGLALALSTGFLKSKAPVFYPRTLNEDIRRISLFLARRGYPHARVTPRFDPHTRHELLRVVFDIDLGPPVIITSTRIEGLPPALQDEGLEIVASDAGAVFVDKRVERITVALDSLLTYSGYARAAVESSMEWQDSTRVALLFDADAGALYYFGDINVTGASDDLIPLVRKTAAIKRGRRFTPQALFDAQRNLRVLGLFRQIRLELQDAAGDTLDVAAHIIMHEPRSFETTVRYWTDDGFSGDAHWTHRNLFNRGRGLKIVLFGSVVRQLAQVSSWWPAILWARSRGVVSVGSLRENEDAYESVSTGIEFSLRHEFTVGQTVRAGVSLTKEIITSKSLDPDAVPHGSGRLLALNFGWDRFAGNHPIVATQGTFWKGMIEWAPPGSLSENQYILGWTTGIVYVPFLPRSGFAARLTIGLGEPIGTSTEIIPNKRFYSGGANSMRGFDRRQLGPLDAAGAPLGGNSKVEASIEFRFPLPWRFRGTLFVDTGQVWSREPNLDERKIEVAVGPGLWIDTPIGPIRGDIGYRLTDWEKSQPEYVFHFSIGPSY